MIGNLPTFSSLEAVQHFALELLLHRGSPASPRGASTREAMAVGFCINQPRARRIINPVRKWSEALAVGEFAWHLSGSNDVNSIAYYAPQWKNFSADGAHIRGSCYGARIFGTGHDGLSQWDRLVRLIQADPQTRRAVLNLQRSPEHSLASESVDVSCVTSCQFLIRDGELHAVTHMRSNDVIWGLPYDVFLFSMLQEMLSAQLKVALGRYYHFAGSFHLYERHLQWAERILNLPVASAEPMTAMVDLDGIPAFLRFEREVRIFGRSDQELRPYWQNLTVPLLTHAAMMRGVQRPTEELADLSY